MTTVESELNAIAAMTADELRTEWRRLMKAPPPRLSLDLMRMSIGYRVQERRLGGLAPDIARELGRGPSAGKSSKLLAGMRLVRSWNGRSIDVLVTDRGFEFEGRNYASLSAIAREITGTVWSGPRFFGLNGNG